MRCFCRAVLVPHDGDDDEGVDYELSMVMMMKKADGGVCNDAKEDAVMNTVMNNDMLMVLVMKVILSGSF